MPDHAPGATIGDVADNDPAEVLVLDEFRLHAATWQTAKRYQARIAARSHGPPASSFRLAVTESGINDEQVAPTNAWVGQPMAGEVGRE